MAGNILLEGFTPNDYLQAKNLNYTNETFNALGPTGMRNALNQQVKYVQPTQAMAPQQPAQSVFKQPDNNFGMTGQAADNYAGGMGLDDPMISGSYAQQTNPQLQPPGSQAPGAAGGGYQTPEMQKAYVDNLNAKTADMNSFDWGGAANVGIGLANTGLQAYSYFADGGGRDMQKEQYGALKDSREYARGAYSNRTAQQSNLGSAFSRNA